MSDLSHLPEPIRPLARLVPETAARQVRITQRGQMWLKPGGRAMAFTAVQDLAVDRVAFSWRARFPLAGPLALRVVDDYDADDGALTVSILGLPLQRQRGAETTVGEALRYVAEVPFVPPALLENRELSWRQIDDREVEVATTVIGERVTATLELNDAGEVVRMTSAMRKLKQDGEWRSVPWGGECRDYAHFGTLYLPTTAQAHWELESGRYVYWRGSIIEATLVDAPFRR